MERSVYVYGGLLAALLVGAYFSWTHEETEERESESAVVWKITPEQVSEVVYETPKFSATLIAKDDALGRYLWGETDREKQAPPNPHEPPDANPAPRIKSTFKVSGAAGEELLKSFAPFVVRRNLGVIDDARSKEFGFDKPNGTLKITADRERVFEIGGFGYGQRHTYLRDTESREVYAVRSRLMKPLQHADDRLPERLLFPYQPTEIDSIVVTVGDQTTKLRHLNPFDASKATWVIGESEEGNELAKSWLQNKFFAIQSTEFTTDLDPETLELLLTARISPRDGAPIQVELYRGSGGDEKEPMEFARSTYTRGFVKLEKSAASDSAQDFSQVLAP
jgi:hypothetical protein